MSQTWAIILVILAILQDILTQMYYIASNLWAYKLGDHASTHQSCTRSTCALARISDKMPFAKEKNRNSFQKHHQFYPPYSKKSQPAPVKSEWGPRLSKEEFNRVAKPSPSGDSYELCDAEGTVGTAKLLRPRPDPPKAVDRYLQQGRRKGEMKMFHEDKVVDMWNEIIGGHHLTRCNQPAFRIDANNKKGFCWKQALSCKNCEYKGLKHKLYEEIPSEGRGAKTAAPNAGFQIGMQESSLGITAARTLMACANVAPPTTRSMRQCGQKAAMRATKMAKEDLKRRRRETTRTNTLRGLPGPSPIGGSYDVRYNSIGFGSRHKAGQNASQAVGLLIENQTAQKQVIGVVLENKLCWKGAWLRNQGCDVQCPGHQGCSATLPASEPLSERRMGEILGEELAQDHVPIKYLTTDGDARGAEGMLEGMRKHQPDSELIRKADPIHIGQAIIRELKKSTFSDGMFASATKEEETDQKAALALDFKTRCYAILKHQHEEHHGQLDKIRMLMPGIVQTMLDCYAGDHSHCGPHTVCKGGRRNNWWKRSVYLIPALMQRDYLDMTDADRSVLGEIANMMLGEAALDLLDQRTDTAKNEAINRSLSVNLPKNVNFSREAYNRMHATVHRVNNGPGESCLLKLEAAGCPIAQGGRVAKFFKSQQSSWERQKLYTKSRRTKYLRKSAVQRQRAQHFQARAVRREQRKDRYQKFQLDPKAKPEVSRKQQEQRRHLKQMQAKSKEARQNRIPCTRAQRLKNLAAQKQMPPTRRKQCKKDHTYSKHT